MTVGSGYSVEAQLTGQELICGNQFEIMPGVMTAIPATIEDAREYFPKRERPWEWGVSPMNGEAFRMLVSPEITQTNSSSL
jgi:hypothetical protein